MEIEEGVPLPEKKKRKSVYGETVEKMKAGDSVYFTDFKEADALRAAGMARGYKMARRKVDTGGFRVWLLEKKPRKRLESAPAPIIPLVTPRAIEK